MFVLNDLILEKLPINGKMANRLRKLYIYTQKSILENDLLGNGIRGIFIQSRRLKHCTNSR